MIRVPGGFAAALVLLATGASGAGPNPISGSAGVRNTAGFVVLALIVGGMLYLLSRFRPR